MDQHTVSPPGHMFNFITGILFCLMMFIFIVVIGLLFVATLIMYGAIKIKS